MGLYPGWTEQRSGVLVVVWFGHSPAAQLLCKPLPSQEGSLAMGVRDSGKVGQLLAGQQGVLRLTSLNW